MKLFKIFILVFFAITLIACGGAEERKAVYLKKAKLSMEAGDLDKARIELKNVLQIDPKDGEAYYQLGKVFEQQKEFRKAYGNYLKAEELNPELLGNQARLGRFYLLLLNDSEKAQEKIDFILLKDPDNSDGLLLKAAVMFRAGNLSEAIEVTKNIIAKENSHVEAVKFLATLYMKENKISEALGVLDDALKVVPDSKELNKLLALFLVKNKDYERAEVIYKKFLEQSPDSGSSYNNLAAFYSQTDNRVKAEEVLRASIENNQDDINRQLTLIQYIRSTKGNDETIKELEALIENNNGAGRLRLALAELLYMNGNKEASIDVYKKAIHDFSEEITGIESRISLASIYFNDKDFAPASKIIEEAFNISPNDPKVNFIRARLALHDKDTEKAIASLRIVIKEAPENLDAYLLLVNAYQLENNKDQVRVTLNSAYENNKMNPDALLKLARYYLTRDIDQSSTIIDDYLNLKASDYEGLSIKAAILNKKKAHAEGYKVAEILMELYPDKASGYLQAVPDLIKSGKRQEAISVLEKGYISAKDNRKLLLLLTTLQVSEKQFSVVEKRIKAELDAAPNDTELKLLLSKVYMVSNNIDSAKSLLREIIDNNADMEEPYLLLADIYKNEKDLKLIKSILLEGKSNIPTSIRIPFRLAAIYELENDHKNSIAIYRELYQSQPDNLMVMNNLASILSDYGNNKDDLEQAKMLSEKLKESGQPVFSDTIGWVYYKLGDYQNAIKYLTQAVEKLPKINVFNYHLGMSYKMSGDKAQAKVYLEKSLVDDEQFKEKDLAKAALKGL